MNNRKFEVFMLKQEVSTMTSSEKSGCGCNCGCGSNSSNQITTIDDLAKNFKSKYNFTGEFNVFELDKDNKQDFILRINQVLSNSNERLLIDELNIGFVLPKITPLIAIDGKILSINNYPSEEELYNAALNGERIPTRSSCC